MTLIDKSGERQWCPTHQKLHTQKRCPKCVAANRRPKAKSYEQRLYESMIALRRERMSQVG